MPGVQPAMHSGELFYPGAHNGPDVSNLNRNSCEQRGCEFRVSRKFCFGGKGAPDRKRVWREAWLVAEGLF